MSSTVCVRAPALVPPLVRQLMPHLWTSKSSLPSLLLMLSSARLVVVVVVVVVVLVLVLVLMLVVLVVVVVLSERGGERAKEF